jgi:hypothetical protein
MKSEFKLLRGYKLKFNFVLPPPIRRMLDDRERMFLPLREIENLQDEYPNLYRERQRILINSGGNISPERERQLSNEGRYDEVLEDLYARRQQQRREEVEQFREMQQRMWEIELMNRPLEPLDPILLRPNE